MFPYFYILFIVMVLAYLTKYTNSRISSGIWFIIIFSLALFEGLRNYSVGTDALRYALHYHRASEIQYIFEAKEFGFVTISWIGNFITQEYMLGFTLVGLITASCYIWAIRSYSLYPILSLFIFLCGGAYTYSFNATSQGLAIAIIILSFESIFKENFKRFFCYVAFASFFHKSALFILPIYFLIVRKNNIKLNIAIILLGIIGFYLFASIIKLSGIVDERFVSYVDYQREAVGYISTIYLCALSLTFLIFKNYITRYRDIYDKLLNMFLLAVVIAVLSLLHGLGGSGPRRLADYLTISSIFIWPIIYYNLKNNEKKIFISGFVPLYLLYYYITTTTFRDLIPYQLNTALF